MKTIGVKITPDRRNLIGASCLKKFPNWECGLCRSKNSQTKKLLIQRNTQECVGLWRHVFCDGCLGLTSAVPQSTLVVFNFGSGEPRKRKRERRQGPNVQALRSPQNLGKSYYDRLNWAPICKETNSKTNGLEIETKTRNVSELPKVAVIFHARSLRLSLKLWPNQSKGSGSTSGRTHNDSSVLF